MSICLLNQVLFPDTPAPHHRFRLIDPEHRREIPSAIEVHTVELTKYNLQEATIRAATAIEQWAFFFLQADRYEAARLRELLPGAEFQRAITVVETIAAKTEDRRMYDQREKAQRDHQWALESAREEGRELGRKGRARTGRDGTWKGSGRGTVAGARRRPGDGRSGGEDPVAAAAAGRRPLDDDRPAATLPRRALGASG